MSAVWSLTVSQFRVRKVRTLLTVLAVALSVSLVVSVTSGFASVRAVAMRYVDRYMGSTDVFVQMKSSARDETFDHSITDLLRKDPRVRSVVARLETFGPLLDDKGEPIEGRGSMVNGVSVPIDGPSRNLTVTAGTWFTAPDALEAVIDLNAAKALVEKPVVVTTRPAPPPPPDPAAEPPAAKVGDTFSIAGPSGPLRLKIVGIVHRPQVSGLAVYVPMRTLQAWQFTPKPGTTRPAGGTPNRYSRALVELNTGVSPTDWLAETEPKLVAVEPDLKLRLAGQSKADIEKNLASLNILSAMSVSVTVVAAGCIIFSTLAMGVQERRRQLAMLRAVGAAKRQVGWLVVLEGLALVLTGIAIGTPAGLLWVYILSFVYPDLFKEGVAVDNPGILFAAGSSLVAALAATIMPAFAATRVSPLEAMGPPPDERVSRAPWYMALAAVPLLALDPILLNGPIADWARALGVANPTAIARGLQFYGHFVVGAPAAIAACFLLAPAFVRVAEALLSPAMATLLAMPAGLLRQQLSAGLWRAAGTCCALMVGLATLVVLQTQGASSLGGWKIPDKFPDMFIVKLGLGGLNDAEQARLAQTPGIKPGDLMPVAIESSQFGSNFLAIAGASALLPDSTLFFGLDPDQANRMTELDFRQGNSADATRLLKQGRHLLVTEEFRNLKGLGVGDTIQLKTRSGLQTYTIAGVVWSPGIDVIVSLFDLGGQVEQRTAYSVFGTLEDARRDFGQKEISVFAANLQPGVERVALVKELEKSVGKLGMAAFDIRQIKAQITGGLGNLLLLASTVSYAAMAVASLGVTNTVMASVRSRRWQFGVLRAVGVTRGMLLRMVLAEAIMLGLVAAVLGLVGGAILTWNARVFTQVIVGFLPPLAIPWPAVLGGAGAVLVIALAASILPAAATARRQPLELLQSGRAAV